MVEYRIYTEVEKMKNIAVLLVVVFLASFVLIGCERKAPDEQPGSASDEPANNLVLTEDVDVAEDQKVLSAEAKRKRLEFGESVEPAVSAPAEPAKPAETDEKDK